jgi:hypothetical protein
MTLIHSWGSSPLSTPIIPLFLDLLKLPKQEWGRERERGEGLVLLLCEEHNLQDHGERGGREGGRGEGGEGVREVKREEVLHLVEHGGDIVDGEKELEGGRVEEGRGGRREEAWGNIKEELGESRRVVGSESDVA